MRKRVSLLGAAVGLLFMALVLGGCSGGDSRALAAGSGDGGLEISFSTEPAQLTSSGSSALNLNITQSSKPVKGASVLFEIWPKGEQQHAQLPAKSEDAGRYYVKGEFSLAGDYYLLAHVTTADGQHVMKTFEFSINS